MGRHTPSCMDGHAQDWIGRVTFHKRNHVHQRHHSVAPISFRTGFATLDCHGSSLCSFRTYLWRFLIALGCLTRFASIIQIPILVTAVFAVNIRQGFSYMNSELWLSMVVLFLVVVFAIIGSGKFSMDEYMRTHDK